MERIVTIFAIALSLAVIVAFSATPSRAETARNIASILNK